MHNLKENNNNTMLKKKCDINVAETIKIAHQMIKLARTGYEQREDDNCGVLYGILLDSGYRLLNLAEKEKHAHAKKGWWNISSNDSTKKIIPFSGKTPVVDIGCCVLCEICVELAPHAFAVNDAGFVEVLPLEDYSDEDIHEAIKNCPKDCISRE